MNSAIVPASGCGCQYRQRVEVSPSPRTNPSGDVGERVVQGAQSQVTSSVENAARQAVGSELGKLGVLLLVIAAIAAAAYLLSRRKE
jgi:hypothetical protein